MNQRGTYDLNIHNVFDVSGIQNDPFNQPYFINNFKDNVRTLACEPRIRKAYVSKFFKKTFQMSGYGRYVDLKEALLQELSINF